MLYLLLAIFILAGLAGGLYLAWSIMDDLQAMEQDDALDDIGGTRKKTDAEMRREIERWRDGK